MNFLKRIFSSEQKKTVQPPPATSRRQPGQRAQLPSRRGETGDDLKGVKSNPQSSAYPSSKLVTDQHVMVMSILSPQDIKHLNGIPAQAAMASFIGEKPPPKLQGNPAFLAFFSEFMNRRAINEPGIIRSALEQREGFIYFIDMKTPDGVMGRVPPEDIIGCLKVVGGRLVPESYQPNPKYCVYREGRGFMELPGPLHRALHEAMLALPPCPSS